jgi:hypothetical protein
MLNLLIERASSLLEEVVQEGEALYDGAALSRDEPNGPARIAVLHDFEARCIVVRWELEQHRAAFEQRKRKRTCAAETSGPATACRGSASHRQWRGCRMTVASPLPTVAPT